MAVFQWPPTETQGVPCLPFVFLNQPRSVCAIFSVLLQLPQTTFCDHLNATETISVTISSFNVLSAAHIGHIHQIDMHVK